MSPPGRPQGEHRSAQHDGSPAAGRPEGEHRSAQHDGSPAAGRPEGEHRSAQHDGSPPTGRPEGEHRSQRHEGSPISVAPDLRCRVCGQPSRFVFRTRLLGAHDVAYFDCPGCGYLQTETPHWLDAAYADAINLSDTGILVRNQVNAGRVVMTLLCIGRLKGRVVDHAGGYGILVRLLRDAGVDARWSDKYSENLVARGFEAGDGPCDLVTAIEAFEHLVDPLAELRGLLARAPFVLLSTDLIRGAAPPSPDWWYLSPHHGQHIGFFRARTLAWMADTLGCHHASDGRSVHFFSRDPVPRLWRAAVRRGAWGPLVARCALTSKTRTDERAAAGPPSV